MHAPGLGKWRILAPLLVCAVVGIVWGSVLNGGFRFDDYPNIVHDPATSQFPAFLDRLSWGVRPLLRASYFLDQSLWGMRSTGFLLTNLLLHLFTSLGVYQLAQRRFRDGSAALAAVLMFAVQPAHAEAVAYITGRSALLSTALIVAGFVAHEQSMESPARAFGFRLSALALFILAVFARETALVFPLLLLVWEWTRTGHPLSFRDRGLRSVLPALAASTLVLVILISLRVYRELFHFSLTLKGPGGALMDHLAALPVNLSLWFRPWALSLVHPAPEATYFNIATGLGVVVILVAATLGLRRRAPEAALAAGWILIALAPTHSLIARLDGVTERALYLAWVGPCFLLAAFLRLGLASDRWRRPAHLMATALIALLAWQAMARATLWTDEVELWTDAVSKAPASSLAWNNLGAALRKNQDLPSATRAFRKALQLDPTNRAARFNLVSLEFLGGTAIPQKENP